MGCGASSACSVNWEKKFAQQDKLPLPDAPSLSAFTVPEVELNCTLPEVNLPGVDIPSVPDIPHIPDVPTCLPRIFDAFTIILGLLDITTNIAVLIRFGLSISIGSFAFILSACVLSLSPHVLSVYEAVNDEGEVQEMQFSWYLVLLNQVHLRTAYQAVYKRVKGVEVEAARVKSLQIKMIFAYAVALPQAVLQAAQMVAKAVDADFLMIASVALALLAVGDALGELTLRANDTNTMHLLHVLFFAPVIAATALGYAYLVAVSPLAGGICFGVDVVFSLVFAMIFGRLFPDFVASTKPLTTLADTALYSIGFVDLNFPTPIPDVFFALKTLVLTVLPLHVPLMLGVDSEEDTEVYWRVLPVVAGCWGVAFVTFILTWVFKMKHKRQLNR